MNKINVLDCTLRDGGYYNNWDFSKELVKDYLKTMSQVGVDFVELGFRSFQTKDFKGPTWYTTDSYLNSFSIPKKIKIGVMVNASELINHSSGYLKATKKMFLNAKIHGINESEYFINKISNEISPEEFVVLSTEFSGLIEEKIPVPKKEEID